MNTLSKKLSILLVFQLVLAAGLLGMEHHRQASAAVSEPLLTFDQEKVDRIALGRGDDLIELVKSEGKWTLPDFHDLPADKTKITQLLTELSGLKSTELVAQTSSSHQRLEVTKDKATAELRLFAGESELAHLLVGKSPAFGKQYVRVGEEADVHAVRLSSTGFQPRGSAWFDRSLLASGKLKKLEFPSFVLNLENGTWKSDDLELDQGKVKALVSLLENLQVFDVSDADLKPDFSLKVTDESGEESNYQFSHQGDEHYILHDGWGVKFKLSKTIAEKFRGAQVSELLAD